MTVIIRNKLRPLMSKQAANLRYCSKCHSDLTYQPSRYRWYCPACRQFTIGN